MVYHELDFSEPVESDFSEPVESVEWQTLVKEIYNSLVIGKVEISSILS